MCAWWKAWQVIWMLPDPILTTLTPQAGLKPGMRPSRKWEGFRALLAAEAGSVTLRSRRGTQVAAAFPGDHGRGGAAAGPDRA
ncbi:hypothetical protein JCM4814A_94430 [Streptomyces phaeofaciens JCM 4814]|uniref:Uncharacterized protein n=1 Tax=Streptomyces phaeofaciens TaxID=68254 RepID=A0A918HTC0_9ACTN|nr:hypothetical protein GCM10010226_92380 [Streptomyces phaeofaciens]